MRTLEQGAGFGGGVWAPEDRRHGVAGNVLFGKRVRDLREAKKRTDPAFSLRRFAQSVGISATFLSKVETGQFDPPSAKTIQRIADRKSVV